MITSLTELERAVRASWSHQTCDPIDLPWSEDNPPRGQCGVTALFLHDLLGGELLLAEVRNADGSRQGVHYWNRLPGGLELDLTRAQFTAGETFSRATAVPVPHDRTSGRMAAQYQRFAAAVHEALSSRA